MHAETVVSCEDRERRSGVRDLTLVLLACLFTASWLPGLLDPLVLPVNSAHPPPLGRQQA
ncbi:unnamed protein product [Protopolystoma xenopodis]|uniref:Uncharacterized protein n=1 Tax=Protopolystoma xenopodis TaxID=117903 RepID=A0A3S5BX70_9PLAT|nr:unnamed protein product [Protopolystoma xenopodis]